MKSHNVGHRRNGEHRCQASAIWSVESKRYTRCRNHGGLSTGPRTQEGFERCLAKTVEGLSGRYSEWKVGLPSTIVGAG
jgi:hypothetical protein